MAEIRPHARFTRWIAAGLLASIGLLAVRIGVPIYRRKQAIDKLQRRGTVISAAGLSAMRSGVPSKKSWWTEKVPADWQAALGNVVSFNKRNTFNSGMQAQARSETQETLKALRQVSELQWLELEGVNLYDDDLASLDEMRNLEILGLTDSRMNGPAVQCLSTLSKLQSLDLTRTDVDDAALEHIAKLTALESLRLDGTRVTNAGLKHLEKLPRLRELSCSQTRVTDAGLDELLKIHLGLSVTDD